MLVSNRRTVRPELRKPSETRFFVLFYLYMLRLNLKERNRTRRKVIESLKTQEIFVDVHSIPDISAQINNITALPSL